MRVRLWTLNVDDDDRRALARTYGETGLASREDFRSWAQSLIEVALADLRNDMERADRAKEMRGE